MPVKKIRVAFTLLVAALFSHPVYADLIPDAELKRRQAQQQEEAKDRAGTTPDVFTPANTPSRSAFVLPEETPCFTVEEIEWRGAQEFDWLLAHGMVVNRKCVGAKGLRALQDYLTSQIISRGYVTSRILIPEQNLASGHLTIQILPGRIAAVRDTGVAAGRHGMALPTEKGALLNQRDLDQGLENIRRVSGQQGVEFDLVPGENPGETDIVIKHPQARQWHLLTILDNSGSDSTGKYQLGAVLTIDSPLGLYDILTATLNNNANISNNTLGTTSNSINWSVPFGYWSFLTGVNQSRYKQTVIGFNGGIVYSGRSAGAEIGFGYVPYRSAEAKTSLQVKLTRKSSRSAIDDTEVTVQRRDVVGYETSISHRQFIGRSTLDMGFGLKGSIPGSSSAPGLIVGAPEWDGSYLIKTANASMTIPLQIGTQNLRIQNSLRMQHVSTLLPVSEFFSIGNRYSVRGFDGISTLSAESGWLLRNDVAWPLNRTGQELYFALDTGRVSGVSSAILLGRSLSGAALGLRGRWSVFSYDFTVGAPLQMPSGFNTNKPTYTASVTAEY